jgi:uncharacterized protein YggE
MKIFYLLLIASFAILYIQSNKLKTRQEEGRISRETNTIEVDGSATKEVDTDTVKISVNVVTLKKTAESASTANSRAVKSMMSRLTNLGVNRSNIQTSGYSVRPKYETRRDASGTSHEELIGYEVSNGVQFTLRNINLASKILDSVSKIEGARVESVNFELSKKKEKAVKEDLEKEAIDDARRKANIALDRIDYEISGVKSVSIKSYNPSRRRPRHYHAMAAMEAEVLPSLYENKQEVSMEVTIIFNIRPKRT